MLWWMYIFVAPGVFVFWTIINWIESVFDRRIAENELREAKAEKALKELKERR